MNNGSESSQSPKLGRANDIDDVYGHFLSPANQAFYDAGVYQPLDPEKREVRLCRLTLHNQSTHLHLELIQPVSLLDGPNYDAISYCAGDPKDTKLIMVNGMSFNMFASVHSLLEQLHCKRYVRPLWIDQLCINQSDLEERARQVMMMQEIYASSYQALLWLGPIASDLASVVEDLVLRLHRRMLRSEMLKALSTFSAVNIILQLGLSKLSRIEISSHSNTKRANVLQHCLHLYKKYITRSDTDAMTMRLIPHRYKIWAGMEHLIRGETVYNTALRLFQRYQNKIHDLEHICENVIRLTSNPWWQRSWVLQEVVSAPEPLIIWGDTVIHFDMLPVIGTLLLQCIERSPTSQIIVSNLTSSITEVFHTSQIRIKLKRNRDLSSSVVLHTVRSRKASDPRDQVYCVLGLLGLDSDVVPCYQSSYKAFNAFSDVTETIILKEQRLDILTIAGDTSHYQTLHLPTWVPDYAVNQGQLQVLDFYSMNFDACLSAKLGKGSSPWWSDLPYPMADFLDDPKSSSTRILACYAINLGSVACSNTFAQASDRYIRSEDRELIEIEQSWRQLLKVAGMADSYHWTYPKDRDEDIETAFQVCLTLGETPKMPVSGQGISHATQRFIRSFKQHILGTGYWRFFVTPDKKIGVAPAWARHDDRVMILVGCRLPLILRPKPGLDPDRDFERIGPCYLHSYMHGRAVFDLEKEGRLTNELKRIQIY